VGPRLRVYVREPKEWKEKGTDGEGGEEWIAVGEGNIFMVAEKVQCKSSSFSADRELKRTVGPTCDEVGKSTAASLLGSLFRRS
jgi:hypothetical protein